MGRIRTFAIVGSVSGAVSTLGFCLKIGDLPGFNVAGVCVGMDAVGVAGRLSACVLSQASFSVWLWPRSFAAAVT